MLASILMSAGLAFAEKTSVENLYHYTLDNGLTVFEAENHAVPLVYIEIAVKTGAKDQTPETAGLFHLYEHMMFKGNALYKDAAQVQNALSELGVTNWNGTTGVDCVNYFFTIPSDRIEDGLAFWNAAIRSPNMDRDEFENEKKVVLSEIEGDMSDPSHIYMNNMYGLLYPDAPYRLSAGGSIPVVKNATVGQLLDIKEKFYIPSNAALFIGGDIDPDETYELVKKIWGSWSNKGKEVPKPQPELNKNPLDKPTAMVMPYDQISPMIANVTVLYRGPDTDFDLNDTYAADYLCQLTSDPESALVQDLYADKNLQIPGTEYIWHSYQTVRQNGLLQFGVTMLNPKDNLPGRAMDLMDSIQNKIIPKMGADESLYAKPKVKSIARYLKDENAITADTATGLLTNLRFWWIATSPEYYYSYNEKMSKVTQKDMKDYFSKYIQGKNALVTVLVNPSVYEETKAEYEKAGFIVADAQKSAWWDNPKYAPDPKKISTAKASSEDIYRPTGNSTKERKSVSSIGEGVKTYRLKNGIPVYIKKDASKRISTVQISSRGGVLHLSPETSGLEQALYYMMTASSSRYDFETRQILEFQTQASIDGSCQESGSIISLNVLDRYFDRMLPVFIDGFLNPLYDEKVYENMMSEYMTSVQTTLNDPLNLLTHTAVNDIYSGHPYKAQTTVTPESIENITIENMKKLHRCILDPSKLFIVAVGNIDEKEFIDMLDGNIGKIQVIIPGTLPEKEIPALEVKEKAPTVLTHQNASGTGYVLRIFEGPSNLSDDYIPATIAADIYSSLMFSIVRESHGVCYTPVSFTVGSKAGICGEELVNLSNYEDFTYAMDNARQLMALGMIVNGNNPGGSFSFNSLENVVESFKNKLINSMYQNQATTASIATSLSINLLHYGDMTHSDRVVEKIRATTAEQIRDAFKKYWLDEPSLWYVIVGPNDKDKVIFKD